MTRWIRLCLLALTLSLTVGCGSIKFTDNMPFNGVGSAVWLELEVNSDEWDSDTYHIFAVSPVAGLCDAYKRSMPDIAAITDDILQADDEDELCEAAAEYHQVAEADFGAFSREGSGIIRISFRDDEDWTQEPRDGDVEGECEEDEDCFAFSLQSFEDDPLALAASAVDSNGGDDGCYDEDYEDDIDDAVDWYGDDGGDITVSHRGSNQIRLDVDVDLDDEDGDNAGDAEGWFSMTRCPVEVDVEYATMVPFLGMY